MSINRTLLSTLLPNSLTCKIEEEQQMMALAQLVTNVSFIATDLLLGEKALQREKGMKNSLDASTADLNCQLRGYLHLPYIYGKIAA